MFRPEEFFDLSSYEHAAIFEGVVDVWEVLKRIEGYVKANLNPGINGKVMDYAYVADDVYIGEGTVVEPGAVVKGPTIIGKNVEVRSHAYLRGGIIVGDGSVVGHTSELKNCLLMAGAQVPHFNYVGDSVLGVHAHLGAGVKISNLKITRDEVVLTVEGQKYPTGLRKFGVIMGDDVEVGCNAVCNPGTVIGPRTLAYPNISIGGYYPADSIIKLRQTHEIAARKTR
ncbi:MAG: hypothetical protein HY318_03020 [Armatimonadetes bacterium]|nr:hypothetical protein [Armatimonadota bacterium]